MPRGPLVFRCDGDRLIGAGHVARCLPLARAFSERGWPVAFVGRYDGLAAWLLSEAQVDQLDPCEDAPLGIHADSWDAAVLDLYDADAAELNELAHAMPTATLAESQRCPEAGIVVDYHLDRAIEESSARLLAGPSYAPIDPRFAALGRSSDVVASALLTVGGTRLASELMPTLIDRLERAFPGVVVLPAGAGADPLSLPSSLVDAMSKVDIAVSAAGFTAYELACAGVPGVVVALTENQRRVASACERAGVAIGIDALSGSLAEQLAPALRCLGDAGLRSRMSRAGRAIFDGRGAARTALALERRWELDCPRIKARRGASHRTAVPRKADRAL